MKSVLIVGCGHIGGKIYDDYKAIHPDRYDPYKGVFEKRDIKYDIAFICVDTPMLEDGRCDISQVTKAIDETDAEICVVRSTIPPTTTDLIKRQTGRRIVFMPEFYTFTHHVGGNDFSFVILGGEQADCNEVVQMLQEVLPSNYRFRITDSTTAELCKYMANCMLATRVSFCVQFWEIANKFGVSYPELRSLLLEDGRFNKSHTFVYDEHPFWKSHCFDKDLPAVTKFADAPLIEAVIKYNEKCKEEYENDC